MIGVPSTGLHTNGYSLARRIAFDHLKLTWTALFPSWAERSVTHCSSRIARTCQLVTAAARDWPHQGHGSHHGRWHHREPAEDSSRWDGGADPHLVVDDSPVVHVVAGERSRAGLRHDAHVQHGYRVDRRDALPTRRRGQERARRQCHRRDRQRGAERSRICNGVGSHLLRTLARRGPSDVDRGTSRRNYPCLCLIASTAMRLIAKWALPAPSLS